MSDQHPTAVVRTSRIEHRRRLSLIWAIPVVTVIIGGWLAWRTLSDRGPLITITFETAEGLKADQSHVLHKDVEMGVTAELGRRRMTVRDLLALTPGSVIELDRAAGSPVDVLVNGTLIARGEVVVIDEEFGIRIAEIVATESTGAA